MAKLDVMQTIKKNQNTIDFRYDLTIKQTKELESKSSNKLDLIFNAFIFGYAQGKKATMAEIKKASQCLK